MGDAKHKHRMVRFSDEDWKDLDETAQEIGSDRSAVIRQLVHAWMGRAGVRPPRRPAPRPRTYAGIAVIVDERVPEGNAALVTPGPTYGDPPQIHVMRGIGKPSPADCPHRGLNPGAWCKTCESVVPERKKR